MARKQRLHALITSKKSICFAPRNVEIDLTPVWRDRPQHCCAVCQLADSATKMSLLRSSGVFVACVRSILRLVSNHHSIPIIIEYWMLDIRYCF